MSHASDTARTVDVAAVQQTAAALIAARRSGVPVPAAPVADAASAYQVQHRVGELMGWFDDDGAHYWKSGGASRDAVLLHAPLPPEGVWRTPAVAGAFPLRRRGVEAEIALRIGVDVDVGLAGQLDHRSATAVLDACCVAIEIVESRWIEGTDAPACAKLADLLSHGALVLGEWVRFQPLQSHDWTRQTCRVRIGNRPEQRFVGTHSLADPCFVLPAWLKHATAQHGLLPAGSVVTTGTWCGSLDAAAGDTVEVTFDGLGTATVRL
jgi:2-keto-4-pentenoate hydratase